MCHCIGEHSLIKTNGLSGSWDQWNRTSHFFSSHFLRVIMEQTSFLGSCTLFFTDVWTNCLNFKNLSLWHTWQIQHWQCQNYGFHEFSNLKSKQDLRFSESRAQSSWSVWPWNRRHYNTSEHQFSQLHQLTQCNIPEHFNIRNLKPECFVKINNAAVEGEM